MSRSALEINMANDIEGLTSNKTVSHAEPLRSDTLRNNSENSTNNDKTVMSYAAAGGAGSGYVPNGCVHRHSHSEAASSVQVVAASYEDWRLPTSSSSAAADPDVFPSVGSGSGGNNVEADPDEMTSFVNTNNRHGSTEKMMRMELDADGVRLKAEEEESAVIGMVDATKISNDLDLDLLLLSVVPSDIVIGDDSLQTTTNCGSPPATTVSPVATRGSPMTTCTSPSTTALPLTLSSSSSSSLASSSAAAARNESSSSSDSIEYVMYNSEEQMPEIMSLITKDLSEPYSIYTYRYFIHNWPKLCFLALHQGRCVGAVVCKLDGHKKVTKRGYIAMLAVAQEYRKRGIGSHLVIRAIKGMVEDGCDEVVLETEITNKAALRLYENLGFVRDKRLFRYYLNGVDALRLKLWLK